MNIEVSIGEEIDKLNILELKLKKIENENKRTEIKKEIECLSMCKKYKNEYIFYYNLLLYVNEKIWDMTDIIKTIKLNTDTAFCFSELSNLIFEYNQKRFRIKNWFNNITKSSIKEQKSYRSTYCKILFTENEVIQNRIPEINYLLLEYDFVIVEQDDYSFIKTVFKQPTIIYNDSDEILKDNIISVDLVNFEIPHDIPRSIFLH